MPSNLERERQNSPICPLCGKPCPLEECVTDMKGIAVHKECYWAALITGHENLQRPSFNCSRRAERLLQVLARKINQLNIPLRKGPDRDDQWRDKVGAIHKNPET